jgi:hypothetical protein
MLGLELPWDYYMLLLGQVREEVGRPARDAHILRSVFFFEFYFI